jgi:hypothetical protein
LLWDTHKNSLPLVLALAHDRIFFFVVDWLLAGFLPALLIIGSINGGVGVSRGGGGGGGGCGGDLGGRLNSGRFGW